ncbi:MAG: GntR family transcriptional regulator [Pseudomonadota bacterium]
MTQRARLMFEIAAGDSRPIGRQIVDAVRRAIINGELSVGAALPSVRGLAQQLAVNPNTVAKAYAELTAEGWVDARAGLGLFIAQPRQRLSETERERRLDSAMERFVSDIIALDFPADVVVERLSVQLDALSPNKRLA